MGTDKSLSIATRLWVRLIGLILLWIFCVGKKVDLYKFSVLTTWVLLWVSEQLNTTSTPGLFNPFRRGYGVPLSITACVNEQKEFERKACSHKRKCSQLGILIIHDAALNITSATVAVLILKAVRKHMLDGSSLFDLVLNWYQSSIPIPRCDSVCINVEYFEFNNQLITMFFLFFLQRTWLWKLRNPTLSLWPLLVYLICKNATGHQWATMAFLPLRCRMKWRHGRRAWSSAKVCSLWAPKHFEAYHQKYEETAEEAPQTFCTWKIQRHKTSQPLMKLCSKCFVTERETQWLDVLREKRKKSYFAMRESVTTIALLKITFRSTGSRMWSGDCFCFRAFFQLPSVTYRKCCTLFY